MKLYGKKEALKRLEGFAAAKRLPHAILLSAEQGVGKKVLADYLAMLYLCEKKGVKPCFSCNECRKTEQRQHPDVVYVTQDVLSAKKKVERMREIVRDGYIMPNDAELRVYIFDDADLLSVECQNTLLKFIEEPLSFNRFIFTASSVNSIIPTVLSRLTRIDVAVPTVDECYEALVDFSVPSEKAKELSKLFSGNIGRALAAAEDEANIKLIDDARAFLLAVSQKNEYLAAASLGAFTTRKEQNAALLIIREILADAVVFSSSGTSLSGCDRELSIKLSKALTLKKLFELQELTGKYISLSETALNVNLTATALAAEFFTVIFR